MHRTLTLSILAIVITQSSSLFADDWNLWRGPNCDGTVEAKGYFPIGSFSLDVLWSKPVGSAYSSASIVDQHVLTMFNDDKSDYLAKIDLLTGQEVWRFRIGKIYKAHDGGHDGPVSTPVADREQVYALGPWGKLYAVDSKSGHEVWSVHLANTFESTAPFWGFTTTPILVEDLVVVQASGQGDHGLIAFEKATGKVRWHREAGRAEYRSPVLANVGGEFQIIASGSSKTIGVNPSDGKLLWSYSGGISNSKTPLYIGNRKVLLIGRGSELVELDEKTKSAKQVWRSKELGGNYDVASFHKGYLYGFTGRHLTCVDAQSGKRLWRSRQPGGKGLIVVDGHLIVLGDHGDVVVAEANPNSYIEKARINVSDGAAYSWPCFADGTIVVRNLKHMVALRPKPVSIPTSKQRPFSSDWFNKFVDRVDSTNDKEEAIEVFLAGQSSLPIIEDEEFVHFVYRGTAKDVGIQGTMLASGEQDSMQRIEGTNCFYRSYRIEPGANWQYQFIVDFGEPIPDPNNPNRGMDNPEQSELFTRSWKEPNFTNPFNGENKGRFQPFQFQSRNQNYSSNVSVYLPHNYQGKSKHKLFVVLNGEAWLSSGKPVDLLNNIFETETTSPVVAFVMRGGSNRILGGGATRTYSATIAKDLDTQLRNKFRIDKDSRTTIVGHRGAAVTAAYSALRYPNVFGRCVTISYGRADTVREDMIQELIESDISNKPEFHIAWNRYDVWRPQSFDCREQSKNLSNQLQRNGFFVTGGEDKTGYGWRSWRVQLANSFLTHANSN